MTLTRQVVADAEPRAAEQQEREGAAARRAGDARRGHCPRRRVEDTDALPQQRHLQSALRHGAVALRRQVRRQASRNYTLK